ncbi:hypothetical protein QEH59_04595 [Coraliomargarita sp. SDUM461004]|uniref:Uncharacterized protein n=1 Tax=Thalassobacterium sedimentorum TaxID=3041258 RepID=A0ABU1AJ96_9BACT|nr:hypothetical protein [Coraliomargarita sp. SDUM461004]MDQ8193688.1 hypothetical protein [Coraliomargarita sp. SDUM461004]
MSRLNIGSAPCVSSFWAMLSVIYLLYSAVGKAQILSSTDFEEAPVQVSFRIYLWPQNFDISGYISDGEGRGGYRYVAPKISYQESIESGAQLIDVGDGQISDLYHYSGLGPLVFFQNDAESGERIPLGVVAVEQLSGDVLLIFFPNTSGEGSAYNILPVEAPTKRIPDGKAMFYNLTRQTLAMYTGKDPQIVAPRAVTLMSLGREDDNLVPVRIMVKVNDSGEWLIRHTEYQTISDDEKLLFFVFPRDAESNRVRVLSINTAL